MQALGRDCDRRGLFWLLNATAKTMCGAEKAVESPELSTDRGAVRAGWTGRRILMRALPAPGGVRDGGESCTITATGITI